MEGLNLIAAPAVAVVALLTSCGGPDVDYWVEEFDCEEIRSEAQNRARNGLDYVRGTVVRSRTVHANVADFPHSDCERFRPQTGVMNVVVEEVYRRDAEYAAEEEIVVTGGGLPVATDYFFGLVVAEPLEMIGGEVIQYRPYSIKILNEQRECAELLADDLRQVWESGEYGERQSERFLAGWRKRYVQSISQGEDPDDACYSVDGAGDQAESEGS